MANDTPMLSWGVENIDQPRVKKALAGVTGGLQDTVKSVLQEMKSFLTPSSTPALQTSGVVGSQSGAQQPGESTEAFRQRTQAAVDAGTYKPPTREAFGAGVANQALDIGRTLAEKTIGTPITTGVMKPTPAPVEAPTTFGTVLPPGTLKGEFDASRGKVGGAAGAPVTTPAAAPTAWDARVKELTKQGFTPFNGAMVKRDAQMVSDTTAIPSITAIGNPNDPNQEYGTETNRERNRQRYGVAADKNIADMKKERIMDDMKARRISKGVGEALLHTIDTQAQTEATREGHKVSADASLDYRKANLAERTAAREAREDANRLAREGLNQAKAEEHKRKELLDFDRRKTTLGKTATGEHSDEKSLFEMIHIGEPIPEEYRQSAIRVYQPFRSVIEEYEKKTGKKLTPSQLDEQKKNYIKNNRPDWSS